MSGKTSQIKHLSRKFNPNLEIAVANRVINLILSHGWTDYDNFSSELSGCIVDAEPQSEADLICIIKSFKSPFFSLNNIGVGNFIEIFPIHEILNSFNKYVQIGPLTFIDIFPETKTVSINEGKKSVEILAGFSESKIQETLVDSLREKNASNCRGRTKDTVLEVADLEHFSLNVQGVWRTFTVVVKGYKSVHSKTITWESIAHQIIKAYRTNPDHILVVLAKNLADSVTSDIVKYSKDVGNENLVIMVDPETLVRFLMAKNVI
ncbi:MAG: hypothetical protein M1371_10285 [Actinobacteria bacterium]|nr:hypothetical protein [Actinomycetota bacterium]